MPPHQARWQPRRTSPRPSRSRWAPGGGSVDVADGTTATLSGFIGGTGGLSKTDTGILVLTGADNYAGGTTVEAGTLQIGPNGTLNPAGALTVNGGTFDLENGSLL